MCDVKPDPENPEICRGCLSTNRKLSSVASMDLYYSLLTEDQKLEALAIPHIALCWECQALLQRTRRFLAQLQRAHDILQDSIQLSPKTSTLSLLTFHKKIEYDAVFEESTPPEQPLLSETLRPAVNRDKVIIPTKYKAKFTESNIENIKTVKDVTNDTSTTVKNDEAALSDDSEDYDNIGADVGDSSSSEDVIEIKDDDLPLINQVKQNDVALRKDIKLKDDILPTTNQVKQNDVTLTKGVNQNRRKLMPRVNRKVENNIKKQAPFVKTPAMLKLELTLKKLMQQNKVAPKKASIDSKKECGDSKLVNDENKHSKDISKVNAVGSLNDDDTSEEDTYSANNDKCETKKRYQKKSKLEDPDFNLEGNNEDYATDDSEEFKQFPKKKTKIQSDTNANSDVEDNDTMDKQRRFKKTITHYKNIADVFPYFTEIEMSQQDLKSTLDKDDAIVDEKKPYKCSICGMTFKLARLMTNHALLLHKSKYPHHFKKGYFQNPPLVMPEKSVWKCSLCDRMMRKEHIVGHMNVYHRTQYMCNCDGCEWWQRPFWKKEDFDQHLDSIHKQFICDICEESKKIKKHLETHIQEAHATSYKCRHCPKIYTLRRSCKQHENIHHGPPEPAELRYCVECDFTFRRIATFKKHFNTNHSGRPKPQWPCDKCGKVLVDKKRYINHVKLHDGKTDYCCHICGKYLSRKEVLQKHLDRHNNTYIPIPKDKPCLICGRMFRSARALRRHTYTHTGERPYKCPHCEAAFTQPFSLTVHLKKKHDVDASVRSSGIIVPATVTTETKTREH